MSSLYVIGCQFVFNPGVPVRLSDDQIREVTVKSLTYQVKMLQVNTFSNLMVQIVYGRRSDTGCSGKVRLSPSALAKPCGQ